MSTERWMRVLTWLGALPFLLPALLLLAGHQALPVLGVLAPVVASYGLVIATFMSGVLWGQGLQGRPGLIWLLPLSNVLTLLAWFAFLLATARVFWSLLGLVFVLLLLADHRLWRQGVITTAYWRLRCGVTGVVLASLLVILTTA